MKTNADPLTALNDVQLTEQIRQGNNRAFDVLMMRYTPRHKIYLHKLLHDYEDLVDDALQTAWMSILLEFRKGHYHDNGHFEKWLNKIVYNTAMKIINAEKHYAHEGEEEIEEPFETLPEGLDDTQQKAWSVFKGMHQKMKRVLVLYAIEDLTCKEIGIRMHLGTNTVTKTLSRAYVMMKKATGKIDLKKNFKISAVK